MGHPLAPQQRKPLCDISIENSQRDRDCERAQIDPKVAIKCNGIALHKRGDEIARRITDKDLHHAHRETKPEQRGHQKPRLAPVAVNEEGLQELGEPPKDAKMGIARFGRGVCRIAH